MLALAACSSSPARTALVDRTLPPKPAASFTLTVPSPAIAAGMQPADVAAAALVALEKANGRIRASWAWYDVVRTTGEAPR
jgi:hypothetical protein